MTTPYTPGDREFLADFDTLGSVRTGVNIDRRPDAIILDPLVAYAMGPVALGDPSGGSQNRPWRVRATSTQVLLSRANDANDAWEAETELFSYSGDPIVEIDLAFEQAGRAFVCAERSGEVWFYWFDPTIPDFSFENFGEGRNPRCLLDNPPDTTNSDIMVFYMSDTGNVGLVYRVQNERYQTEHITPVLDSTDRYLEEVVKLRDSRIAAIMSLRDTVAGTYSLERLESTLYPYITDPETTQANMVPVSGLLVILILEHTLFDVNELQPLLVPQASLLVNTVIEHTLFDINELQGLLIPQSGLLVVVIIEHTLFDANEMQSNLVPQSGILIAVVLEHTLFDANEIQGLLVPQSGSLVNA